MLPGGEQALVDDQQIGNNAMPESATWPELPPLSQGSVQE
jgi:hypothetical protein